MVKLGYEYFGEIKKYEEERRTEDEAAEIE